MRSQQIDIGDLVGESLDIYEIDAEKGCLQVKTTQSDYIVNSKSTGVLKDNLLKVKGSRHEMANTLNMETGEVFHSEAAE